MFGSYSGLQVRIKELVEYIPCSAHSLSLVGVTAAKASESAVELFNLSTHLWDTWKEILKNICPVVKSLSITQWLARVDAPGSY